MATCMELIRLEKSSDKCSAQNLNIFIIHCFIFQSSIMLVGHSAGAHLCLMSVLELTLQNILKHSAASCQATPHQPIIFEEGHLDPPTSLSGSGCITSSCLPVDDSNKQLHIAEMSKEVDLLSSIKAFVGNFIYCTAELWVIASLSSFSVMTIS